MGISHHRTAPLWLISLAYAGTVLIWGTTWLAIKYSLRGFGPITGVGFRFILAALVLGAIATLAGTFRGRAPGELHVPVRLVLALSVCLFGLNYVLTYSAETHLSSGLVAVLFGTLPFFVYGFDYVMLGEPITWRTFAGAACALAGVGTISIVGNLRGDLWYVAAAVSASLLSAFANTYLKRWSHVEPFVILPISMLISGIACAAAGLYFERFDPTLAFKSGPLLALAYLAIMGSACSFYLMHWLLQRINSGAFGLSALMIPVIAVVVGILFGGEAFSARDVLGAALVISGVWLALARTRTA